MVKAESPSEQHSRWSRIYGVVEKIPKGKVATYGQIAELADMPRAARQVGFALNALTGQQSLSLPWHRVINAQGRISQRAERDAEHLQREILESEGIVFSASGRIDLARFGWRPVG